MDSPTKNKTSEATGISRSGRVRKKSSKLTDFESPDEIDTRFKRRTDRPQKVATPKTMSEDSDSYMDEEIIDVKDEPLEVEEWGVEGEEMEEGEEEEEEEESVGGEDGGEGNLQEFSDSLQVDEDSTDVSRETSSYTQAQSLYFSEKQGKKSIVMKGGQVVRRKKAQRKDKGKSRFTAYMLWAREVRPGIIQANPNMDFSAVNKRLGELWALVPTTQKYNWKRRAKRLAAKGNQKGGLISTGRPSRPPPPARANLINKGGVKPAPRPDPNPTPPPPSLTSQGAGHHRQPGQKNTQSRRKRPQSQESPAAIAPKRLGVYPSLHLSQTSPSTGAAIFKKKYLDQMSPKESHTIVHKMGLGEYLSKCPAPSGSPLQRKKHFKGNKEFDSSNQKQGRWKTVTRGKEAEGTGGEMEGRREAKNMREELRERPELKGILGRDCTANNALTKTKVMTDDSMINSSICHQPTSVVDQSPEPFVEVRGKPYTMDSIFRDIFADGSQYCPWSLVRAVAGVTQKKLTLEKASTLYCVSPSRLQMCLSYISILRDGKCKKYDQLVKEMRRYPTREAVREWLLRMRRMGRLPVNADVKQVLRFMGKFGKIKGCTGNFIKLYGEEGVSQEEWAVLSPSATTQWHSHFQDHIFVRCGMNPREFLTSKNRPRVFTSAEVVVGLGDLPLEVIVARGRSNLYCLTHKDQGVARAILTFSAAGQFHSPAIIQKGYYSPQWALSEDSVDLIASPDGRWDPLLFLSWLRLFEERLTQNGVSRPVILFVHGHPAHASPAADAFCSAKRIILHSHHHSPINPMDPFIHLLPPLLHHLAHTQEQLTVLTGIHPLPDHLLPSILADAWTQVSKENLAGEAFQKSGLVPFTGPKHFPPAKYSKMSYFPPLLLQPLKAYLAAGDALADLPYHPEPQLYTIYHLLSAKLCQKVSIVDKVNINQEKHAYTEQVDEENIIDENFDETCEPHCVAPDPTCDPSMMESGKVVLMESDSMSNSGSPADDSTQRELDDSLLNFEVQEGFSLSKSIPSSPDNHERPASCTGWEDKEVCDNLSETCDPLYVGPDPLSDPSVMESERVIHIHNNLMVSMRSPTNTLEKSPEEELGSSVTCEFQAPESWSDSRVSSHQTEHIAYDNVHTGLLEDNAPSSQPHSMGDSDLMCDFTNLGLLKKQIKNEEITPARFDENLLWIKEEVEEPTETQN
ncbi:uncharacterized protein LOC127006495 isoform X1 [Eriocheir sinensis]|uniref:uncharacterized protein LOC127006495 isoform X1 n=1 Tax=Eriocheir sinensis TaxID=95602 RepID=UPI0021CA4101|nr:uncharacterized protein LOC127006495 isoform X1 [Eriocheir sinensis]